ncbi:fatty acyl-CoA hydrolase precursor, medium chain-like [Pomacea canaliculata]|uniref:fatty acyl-CoA hydrolase precursor, medium chain-like n=1 Tax=Pomacea canaliculata TaxID=400727 RepID=UPI000D72EE9B|nr:fatty acyl-CoA hydrolase precursor, medium chain-like [Pomacea canaliculata]
MCLGMACDCLAEDVQVTTRLGIVRGRRVSTEPSGSVDMFLGIPYAQPPVGSHRFQRPRQSRAWAGVRDVTSFGAACPQLPAPPPCWHLRAEEDCLNLNVYSPTVREGKSSLLPVMVWIHGGGYRLGSGAYSSGIPLASRGVVVVTLNYRMDALGFLSTEDDACPGNFGLLDQIMALQWVRDNIDSFHGNPNQVTIFGSSAGGASVSLLRLSPLAAGLFNTTIIQSGVSLSPWAVGQALDPVPPAQWARRLAQKVGCTRDRSQALLTCLQPCQWTTSSTPAPSWQKRRSNYIQTRGENIFGVVPDRPVQLLRNGVANDAISVRGFTRDEYSSFMLDSSLLDFSRRRIEEFVRQLAQRSFPRDPDTAASAIINHYISQAKSAEQLREADRGYSSTNGAILVNTVTPFQALTDFYIVAPTMIESQAVAKLSGKGRVYLYQFSYRATHYSVPSWAGIPHGSDLPFIFGTPLHMEEEQCGFRFNWTSSDVAVSSNVMSLWTNIAKYGNPTPTPLNGTRWTPYDLQGQEYLDIGTSLTLKARLKEDLIQFWTNLFHRHGYLDPHPSPVNSSNKLFLPAAVTVLSGWSVLAIIKSNFRLHVLFFLWQ